MLGAIRNKSKGWVAYLIVGLITVPFALFGIQDYASRSANTSIAKVDGEDIDINIYYQELNTQQRNLQQQLGAAYSQEIDDTLKQSLLDSLINEKLIENYANSLDIANTKESYDKYFKMGGTVAKMTLTCTKNYSTFIKKRIEEKENNSK